MSKIVSPYPPHQIGADYRPHPEARWWRLKLEKNHDGNLYTVTIGDNPDAPTWIEWEFFDGENAVIDTGFDKPSPVVLTDFNFGARIDVLYVGAPTPNPGWQELQMPGTWPHPEIRADSSYFKSNWPLVTDPVRYISLENEIRLKAPRR